MISVIIPAYNAESFVEKAIRSVLDQTFSDYEIVVINDGSSDKTAEICCKLSNEHSKIRFFSVPNGGASSARSVGVAKSRGSYITFLDADDTFESNALAVLNKAVVVSSADIAVAEHYCKNSVCSKEVYIRELLDGKISTAPFKKLFNRRLFDEDTFSIPRKIVIGEDLIMNVRLASNANYVYEVSAYIYNYAENELSITHTFKRDLEHELVFYSELERSLDVSMFAPEIINRKLISYDNLLLSRSCSSSKDIENSIKDMSKEYGAPLNLLEKLIVSYENEFVKIMLAYIDKVIRKIKNVCFSQLYNV